MLLVKVHGTTLVNVYKPHLSMYDNIVERALGLLVL